MYIPFEFILFGALTSGVLLKSIYINCYKIYFKYTNFYNCFKYIQWKSDILLIDTNCTICMEDFIENEKLLLIKNCNHSFHKKCLLKWIKDKELNSVICPNCGQICNNV